ncbi:MAG: hypothetical protein QHJ82_16570 [Verrucomicrobiota bacterium]|nr:hypothetical protein [Verrucomicrobiota bacterium]
MQFRVFCTIALSALALWLSACSRKESNGKEPAIATTTSYLEAAASDLLRTNAGFLRLAEPGTCPGHFDIRPSEVQKLRSCRILLRFDFQKSLDARLNPGSENKPRICEVALGGGMGQPETYLLACEQVARHLVAAGLLDEAAAESRLRDIKSRLAALSAEVTNRVARAGLVGLPVIASHHQQAFCKWLGLNVVAVFRAADTAGIREINDALEAGKLASAKVVIANLPEGRRTADALAARLKACVVVFENFPMPRDGAISFDNMVMANLDRLLEGVKR